MHFGSRCSCAGNPCSVFYRGGSFLFRLLVYVVLVFLFSMFWYFVQILEEELSSVKLLSFISDYLVLKRSKELKT